MIIKLSSWTVLNDWQKVPLNCIDVIRLQNSKRKEKKEHVFIPKIMFLKWSYFPYDNLILSTDYRLWLDSLCIELLDMEVCTRWYRQGIIFPLSICRKHHAALVNSKLIVVRYREGHEVCFMRCLKIDYSVRSHYSDINKLIMEVCTSALRLERLPRLTL